MRRIVGCVALALLLNGAFPLSTLAFTSGYSFLDAQKSPPNYRLGTIGPRLACKDLLRFSDEKTTILLAETVAPTGDVPAFCRVVGIIQPEVKFEVALRAKN